ncbi:MAG: HD domain-containing protein [Methanocellales archaeon]|nr:HD domain-containing protein [Methanocellales archaeon]
MVSKNQFVKDLRMGDNVDTLFAVKYKKPPREYTSGFWFEFRVSDNSGEITAKYWGDRNEEQVKEIYEIFQTNDVVHITGRVSEFRERLEIALDTTSTIRRCGPSEYDIGDFVAKTSKDTDQMMREIMEIVDFVNNPHLKSLLHSFFDDLEFAEKFRNCPGSMHRHQNYIGGLLEHTLNVVKLCNSIHMLHPSLDKDLLLTGAILHDIGKIKEYAVTTSIDISEEGMLRGHLIMGEQMVLDRIERLENFPDILRLKLAHILLSHHGHNEYGSPKKPQFPEALAIYHADECDAKVDYCIRLKKEAETEDPWIYTKDFNHIYLR